MLPDSLQNVPSIQSAWFFARVFGSRQFFTGTSGAGVVDEPSNNFPRRYRHCHHERVAHSFLSVCPTACMLFL
jgi:hypothetical protein